MQSKNIICTALLFISAVYAATIADVIAANNALTPLTDSTDIAVVAITAQTDPTAAQRIPTALQSLTNAITAALTPPAANPNSPPPVYNTITNSFGLFANNAEELMYDYVEQKGNLAGVFGQQSAIYSQLGPFNTAFQNYATFVYNTADNAGDKTIIGYNTANTTQGIQAATSAYAP